MRTPKIAIFILALLCSACGPSMRIAPGQLPAPTLPDQQLKSQAEYAVKQYVDQTQFDEIKTGAELRRITALVDRLGVAAGYPPRTFPVHLVDAGEEVNAAAFNGASVVVYVALLRKVKSDAELSVILGHEMGHILAKHYTDAEEEKSRASAVGVGASLLGTVASIATSAAGYGGASGLAGSVTETSTGLIGYGAFVGSFSRTQEYEADHLGLLIMAKAGYDPRIAPEFWKRSEEIFGSTSSSAGAFFSTHPAEADRQKALEEALPYALQFYNPANAAPPSITTDTKPAKGKPAKKQRKVEY